MSRRKQPQEEQQPQEKKSKDQLNIKTLPEVKKEVKNELDYAKERGLIKQDCDYFKLTLRYFKQQIKKMELANEMYNEFENNVNRQRDIMLAIIEQFSEQSRLDNSKLEKDLDDANERINFFIGELQEKKGEIERNQKQIEELENEVRELKEAKDSMVDKEEYYKVFLEKEDLQKNHEALMQFVKKFNKYQDLLDDDDSIQNVQ